MPRVENPRFSIVGNFAIRKAVLDAKPLPSYPFRPGKRNSPEAKPLNSQKAQAPQPPLTGRKA